MKKAVLILLLSLWVAPVNTPWAAQTADVYAATVPVADQSERARDSAAREGMLEVLVRLTGSRTLDEDPRLRSLLRDVQSYMVEYSYVTLPAVEAGEPAGLGVRIQYDRAGIDRFLRTSRLPIWPLTRPALLVWVVQDDGFGETHMFNDQAVSAVLASAFARRGLPFVLPLLDLEDRFSLTPVQVRDFDSEALAAASRRYPVQGWLAVRVYETGEGLWRAAWLMDLSGRSQLRQVQAPTLEALLAEVADQAVDTVASLQTYVAGDDAGGLELEILGVATYRDYSRLTAMLDAQPMVSRMRVVSVDGDRLRLSLAIEGGREQLLDSLYRERNLEPMAAPPGARPAISDEELLAGAAIPEWQANPVERLRWLPGR